MAASAHSARNLPSQADEDRFWTLIESAWSRVGSAAANVRQVLTNRNPDDDDLDLYIFDPWLDAFLDSLRGECASLTSQDLTDLDRVLERKLYDIDRADIQEVTDGSDDGFLYCRGFIVALGRAFYEAVAADSAMAVPDAECEGMGYFFARLHHERFGTFPDTGSGISRESCSNPVGWPD
ncbi:DUF4240 domain-containing protein [Dactylosporangium sp. NPDC051484]|uniref:DUF4240 domain-containing protein n=1 Tax=Dactylosporangium sp. NPDC051484 TaxID=3154942 RepID=UPI00344FB708